MRSKSSVTKPARTTCAMNHGDTEDLLHLSNFFGDLPEASKVDLGEGLQLHDVLPKLVPPISETLQILGSGFLVAILLKPLELRADSILLEICKATDSFELVRQNLMCSPSSSR